MKTSFMAKISPFVQQNDPLPKITKHQKINKKVMSDTWIVEKNKLPELKNGKSADVWIAEHKEKDGQRITEKEVFIAHFEMVNEILGIWSDGKGVFEPTHWKKITDRNVVPPPPDL